MRSESAVGRCRAPDGDVCSQRRKEGALDMRGFAFTYLLPRVTRSGHKEAVGLLLRASPVSDVKDLKEVQRIENVCMILWFTFLPGANSWLADALRFSKRTISPVLGYVLLSTYLQKRKQLDHNKSEDLLRQNTCKYIHVSC